MRLKSVLSLLITLVVFAFVAASPTYAATVNFSGSFNVGDPRMSRVNDDTTSPYPYLCQIDPTQVLYDLYPFYVTTSGSYTLESTATAFNNGSTDTIIALYQGSFSAGAPAVNCLASDDDSGSGLFSLLTFNLTANTQYYMLFQAYSNGVASGTYSGTAKGLGTVMFGTLPTTSSTTTAAVAPDDRVNWLYGDDYAIAYPRQDENGDSTVHIYCVNIDSTGTLYDVVSHEDLVTTPTENTLLAEVQCRIPVSFYVLTTGEYQFNIGPNEEGTVLSIIWRGLPPTEIYHHYFNLYQQ